MSIGSPGKHPVSDRDEVITALKSQDKVEGNEDQNGNKTNNTGMTSNKGTVGNHEGNSNLLRNRIVLLS